MPPPARRGIPHPAGDGTRILQAIREGESSAPDDLLRVVYAELRGLAARRMARESPGQTLQATALVHEAWLKLSNVSFENRAHFFSAAAEATHPRRQCPAQAGGTARR